MGEAFDIAAVTGAWVRMLQAPARPTPGAWWAEREPWLRRLSDEAWEIEVRADDRRGLLRPEAAQLVDGLLAPVARGRGALDVAIGEGLSALSAGDLTLRLGYCSIGDYARERLGIAGRKAQAMAQLARELRERAILREAVLRGEVSARKASSVLPVASGEGEAAWVERARAETVRALEEAVRRERGEEEAEEAWEKICIPLGAEARAELDEGLELAGKVAGVRASRQQLVEAMAQEYLGENPDEEDGEGAAAGEAAAAGAAAGAGTTAGAAAGEVPWGCAATRRGTGAAVEGWAAACGLRPPPDRGFLSWPVQDWLEATKEALEAETGRWEWLGQVEPVAAPRAGEETSPQALDEELRRLAGMRRRWDELLGHLGLVMELFGLWREAGFASFDHYCVERLGMAPRTVKQRVWLERRFYHLPDLREAMRAGRLSYEQARLVAGVAGPVDVGEWIGRAEGMSCIALRRAIEKDEERQMCARETLELRVPVRVADALGAAFRAARARADRWLTPEECVLEVVRHFKKTWQGAVDERSTPRRRARRRDVHCQVPGCSRHADHTHHIIPLSQGGTDDPWNLVGLCAAHHLHAVHRGWLRVSGRAPDQLAWELGDGTPFGPSLFERGGCLGHLQAAARPAPHEDRVDVGPAGGSGPVRAAELPLPQPHRLSRGGYMLAKSIPFVRMTPPKASSSSPEAHRTASGWDDTTRTRCRSACEP